MMRVAAALLSLAALSGCELFDDTDPREEVEGVEACTARVEQKLRLELADLCDNAQEVYTPTYTYDITKLSLEAIQVLSRSDADETKGSRLNQFTNETSTAVDRFMETPVDEDGAFFMGRDPALYRVRGELKPFDEVIPTGCERQQPNMRLISVEFTAPRALIEDPDDTSTEENNS